VRIRKYSTFDESTTSAHITFLEGSIARLWKTWPPKGALFISMNIKGRSSNLSIFLMLMGIIVPVALYFFTLPGKTLSYQVISKSALIGSHDSIENIEIKIKGEVVDSAVIYLLKIKNSGTEPIKPKDFERPIVIKFAEKARIFNAQVKNKLPENISTSLKVSGNKLSIAPLLLNPNDEFIVEVLSASRKYPVFDSRIAGVQITEQILPKETARLNRILLTVGFLLLIFYGRSFWVAVEKDTQILVRGINIVLGLTCVFSAIILTDDIITIESIKHNIWLVLLLGGIAVGVGGFLAKKEKKTMRQWSHTRLIRFRRRSIATGELVS